MLGVLAGRGPHGEHQLRPAGARDPCVAKPRQSGAGRRQGANRVPTVDRQPGGCRQARWGRSQDVTTALLVQV